MGLWTRIRMLFATKASSALDRAEDPREVLDYAYSQQQQLLVSLRRGLVDVATSKQQLEQQAQRLLDSIPKLDDQARRAIGAGREDLARVTLERKRIATTEADSLTKQIAGRRLLIDIETAGDSVMLSCVQGCMVLFVLNVQLGTSINERPRRLSQS